VHDGKHYTVPLPPDRGTGLGKPLTLIGTEDDIALQLKEFAAAGVTTLLLNPLASSPERRVADVATLARVNTAS